MFFYDSSRKLKAIIKDGQTIAGEYDIVYFSSYTLQGDTWVSLGDSSLTWHKFEDTYTNPENCLVIMDL
ncbi:MAG: hypothetical protein Q4E33_03790 [Erysipelotrichaceae bacterium]|nr:hypothetical protein [Erysipelotrichaceae bacterium]